MFEDFSIVSYLPGRLSSKTFLFCEEDEYTYKEFLRLSNAVSFDLQTRYAVKSNEKVGVLTDNSPCFIFYTVALWKLGAVPVPLNIRLLPSELNNILKNAGIRIVCTEKKYAAKLDNTKIYLCEKDNLSFNVPESINGYSPEPNDTALIMFTSGSSGKPKGVKLTFGNLTASANAGNNILQQSEDDEWLASLPFYHIGGFSIITRALLSASSIIIPSSLSTDDLIEAYEKHKPTLFSLVSTQIKRFIERGINPHDKLKTVLLGGGFIDPLLVKKAIELGWKITKVYGSTETASFITALTVDEFSSKPGSAGKPLPGNKIIIKDEKENTLSKNTSGEIIVKAESVAKGYLKNKKETEKKFKNGLYYTGDYGYIDDDGYLFVEAKRTDLIVSGGENINPVEVEMKILEHEKIKEVCVIGIEDDEWGHVAVAALVTEKDQSISSDELKDFLKDKLPSFKIPKKIFYLNELPKTDLGKVRRAVVKDLRIKK